MTTDAGRDVGKEYLLRVGEQTRAAAMEFNVEIKTRNQPNTTKLDTDLPFWNPPQESDC